MPYIHIGRLSVPTFGLTLWLAAVVAAFVMDRGFRRARINADAVGMVAVAVVAGIVGAKLWHVIDTPLEFQEQGWRVLWDSAGFAWFGGLILEFPRCLFRAGCPALAAFGPSTWPHPPRPLATESGASAASSPAMAAMDTYQASLGHELSQRHRAYLCQGPSHAALRVCRWAADRRLAVVSRRQTPGCGSHRWRVPGAERNARFLVEFVRRNPKVLGGVSNAQLAAAASVLAGIVLVAWAATRPAAGAQKDALAGPAA